MSKLCLGLASVLFCAAISFSGCCAPMGPIGPGCTDFGCSDCSGCGTSPQYIANGPLDALRNARRRMVCGSGCGEAYVGEWISTPPDAVDPCCGDQFVGGATKCRPFCWQPGNLLRGLYGQRLCSGNASSTPCACGTNFCDGGCGTMAAAPVMGTQMITAPAASSCGCSASNHAAQQTTRIVNSRPAVDNATATRTVVATKPKPNGKRSTQKVAR